MTAADVAVIAAGIAAVAWINWYFFPGARLRVGFTTLPTPGSRDSAKATSGKRLGAWFFRGVRYRRSGRD